MTDSPIQVAHATGRYPVTIEPLARLPRRLGDAGLEPGRVLVVTDTTVAGLHLDALSEPLDQAGWAPVVRAVAPGEQSKSSETYHEVLDWALGLGLTRATPLVAFGGGVVGDLGGFAAATLLRGLPLVQVPTTTISQVDSAIGGKTGINHAVGKNLIGAFWPPRLVLADPSLLQTLDARDYLSGLAEAVKHAMLSGDAAVGALNAAWPELEARSPSTVADVISSAARVKAEVVSADEREGGRRAFLNLGHTFAHAVEKVAGYGTVTHGEAVAFGLRAALHLSAALASPDLASGRLDAADRLAGRLPQPALGPAVTDEKLIEAMASDKKRDASGLRFVVLDAPGSPRLAGGVARADVAAALLHARSG